MAIGNVVQNGPMITIYDERGQQIGCIMAGSGQLVGYTGLSVSVKNGPIVTIYNERGQQKDHYFA